MRRDAPLVLLLGPQTGDGADRLDAWHIGIELGPGREEEDLPLTLNGRSDERPLHDVVAEPIHPLDDEGPGQRSSHQKN